MDEISSLSREIEFHERFRGYDPDEVDAYVDKVRNMAAQVTGRLSELHARAEAAEARIAAGRGDSTEENLARTLLLAQRTADELVEGARAEFEDAVAEARAEAAILVGDAEERSSLILAEAETDRRTTIAAAEDEAAAAAVVARDRLAAEVRSLTDAKAFLDDDISILERHLEEQRANLSQVVSSLSDLIDDPGTFRVSPAPATSGVDVAAMVADLETATISEDGSDEAPFTEQISPEPESVEADVVEIDFPRPDFDDHHNTEVAPTEHEVIDLDEFTTLDHQPTESGLPAWDTAPARLLTAADMAGESEVEEVIDQGPATAPVGVIEAQPLFAGPSAMAEGVAPKDSESGRLNDDGLFADDSDALSAFFDQDDEVDRSWFGRRR